MSDQEKIRELEKKVESLTETVQKQADAIKDLRDVIEILTDNHILTSKGIIQMLNVVNKRVDILANMTCDNSGDL